MSIASEITRINTNIANAYTAMEAKGATLPATQNSANLASTVNTITGGGVDIQGIIEEYEVASGGNISAGDFVKFIDNIGGNTDTEIDSTNYSTYTLSATLLSNDKVFIAHGVGGNENRTLYGVVITINGTTITVGTDTQLSSSSGSGYEISVVKVDTDKVFIVHSRSSSYYLYGMVCTISGTTITVGTDTQLSSNAYTGYEISAIKLDTNKVFIAHSYGGSYYLYGMVCTISGTTITAGTDTQLSSSSGSGYEISVVKVDTDKVFIAHSYSSSYYLYGIVCTISGTTITAGTDTAIYSSNANSGREISVVALDTDKVFIAHSYNSTNYYLYGIVCTISETTITKGSATSINNNQKGAGYEISVVALDTDKVFIAHSYGDSAISRPLYGIICKISGTTITKETDKKLSSDSYSGNHISAVKTNGIIFIAHSYGSNYYLYGMIGYQATVDTLSSEDEINGIAKEAGTAGDTIEVYVPDI